MKKSLIVALACLAVTGCSTAGLNVSWSVVATYNTPHAVPGAPIPAPVPVEGEQK